MTKSSRHCDFQLKISKNGNNETFRGGMKMANFDDFKQKTTEAAEYIAARSINLAKAAAEKTKLIAKISRIKAEIITEKDSVRRAYLELGKLYYMNFRDDAAPTLAAACDKISASLAEIMIKKAQIEECKAELKNSDKSQLNDEPAEVWPDTEEIECCAKTDDET